MTTDARAVVPRFFADIRSGAALGRVEELMAPRVLAHQAIAEGAQTIERTPADYADHVRDMRVTYGDFALEIEEMIAEGDRVYVRWRQTGEHLADIEGFAPSGRKLVELASAVYRVEEGRIVEYWIQVDRAGMRAQLERA